MFVIDCNLLISTRFLASKMASGNADKNRNEASELFDDEDEIDGDQMVEIIDLDDLEQNENGLFLFFFRILSVFY